MCANNLRSPRLVGVSRCGAVTSLRRRPAQALASVQGGVAAGTYVHASKLTLDKACEAWLVSKHSLNRRHSGDIGFRSAHCATSWGMSRFRSSPRPTWTGWWAGCATARSRAARNGWSARSVNYMLYLCSAVLDDQVAQGNAVRNVARLVDRIPGEAETFRTLTEQDMFAILVHASRDRHLWAPALYGLRRGEIAGLRWCNFDLNAKTVTVSENRVAVAKEIMTGTPKSKASTRTLPMPDGVVEVLRAARKTQAEERLACGAGYGSGEYVASTRPGSPITRTCSPSGGADARRKVA